MFTHVRAVNSWWYGFTYWNGIEQPLNRPSNSGFNGAVPFGFRENKTNEYLLFVISFQNWSVLTTKFTAWQLLWNGFCQIENCCQKGKAQKWFHFQLLIGLSGSITFQHIIYTKIYIELEDDVSPSAAEKIVNFFPIWQQVYAMLARKNAVWVLDADPQIHNKKYSHKF